MSADLLFISVKATAAAWIRLCRQGRAFFLNLPVGKRKWDYLQVPFPWYAFFSVFGRGQSSKIPDVRFELTQLLSVVVAVFAALQLKTYTPSLAPVHRITCLMLIVERWTCYSPLISSPLLFSQYSSDCQLTYRLLLIVHFPPHRLVSESGSTYQQIRLSRRPSRTTPYGGCNCPCR